MPITILHFGVMAPVRHYLPGKVHTGSFILANLWMDAQAIVSYFLSLPLPDHGFVHTFLGALLISIVLTSLYPWNRPNFSSWVIGAFLGTFTHVTLDMLIHPEMDPMYPFHGNPYFQGWMEPLSLFLVPLTIWFIFQIVSDTLDYVRRHPEP